MEFILSIVVVVYSLLLIYVLSPRLKYDTLLEPGHSAWKRSFRRLILEVDSLEVINILSSSQQVLTEDILLVAGIHGLLQQDWEVVLRHVGREGNQCTDRLATCAIFLEPGLHLFREPSVAIQELLHYDAGGALYPCHM